MRPARRAAAVARWAGVAALLASAAIAPRMLGGGGRRDGVPADLGSVLLRAPAKLAPVRLVDHRGTPVTSDELFTGGWSFVFLGFASCPNVCPATLSQLAQLRASFGRQLPGVPAPRFVFVTVDPRRDTPARLASYLAAFDPAFIGATGEPAQIAALSDALTAFHGLRAQRSADDYGVVHSGEVYLLDPAGRAYARFTPPLDLALIPRQVAAMMALEAGARGRS